MVIFMCPGGQVNLTSTDPSELCIIGMSFSRRSTRWSNAALVVSVLSKDFDAFNFQGSLAGVEFQREFVRKAAIMGGGYFVVPVQTVTDFLESKLSVTSMPSSSYHLGVKAANLYELFPLNITKALQQSILMFDKEAHSLSTSVGFESKSVGCKRFVVESIKMVDYPRLDSSKVFPEYLLSPSSYRSEVASGF